MENIIEETKIIDAPKKKNHKKLIIILSIVVLLLATLVTLFCVFKKQIAKKVLSEEEYALLYFYDETQRILEVSDVDYKIDELYIIDDNFDSDNHHSYTFYVLYESNSNNDSEYLCSFTQKILNTSEFPYVVSMLQGDTNDNSVWNYCSENKSNFFKNDVNNFEFSYSHQDLFVLKVADIKNISNLFNEHKEKKIMICGDYGSYTTTVITLDKLPLKIKIFA